MLLLSFICLIGLAQATPTIQACGTCQETLGNTNLADDQCAIIHPCASCAETKVKYHRDGQCLRAVVSCPPSLAFPRVRLLSESNRIVPYEEPMSNFTCTGDGWSYTNSQGKVTAKIRKVFCFGDEENAQPSPLDIRTHTTVYDKLYEADKFSIDYKDNIARTVNLVKEYKGFHVQIKENAHAYFTASHLNGRYRLLQYHGHWNVDDTTKGSEHRVDGKGYAAELHFVHVREEFATLEDALAHNAVAVVALFFEIGDENRALRPLIEAIEQNNARHEGLLKQNPSDLFPANRNYFAYTGSLTTSPYKTCVSWNALHQPVTISKEQLAVLGRLIKVNVRDVQKSLGTVYTSLNTKKGKRMPTEEKEGGKAADKLVMESDALKPIPSSIQSKKETEEEKEESVVFTKEELVFLRRLSEKLGERLH